MTTYTYDPSTDPEVIADIEANEAESLEVGERMAQEQADLLAGKFKSAEDLEKAYLELQSKLGGRTEEEAEEDSTEEAEEDYTEESEPSVIDSLFEEFSEYGQLTQETAEALGEEAAEIIEQLLSERQSADLQPEEVQQLQSIAGGTEEYQTMVGWARDNLSPGEIEAYNNVISSGSKEAIFFAIQALKAAYLTTVGTDGELVSGRAATSDRSDVFRSQAEVVRAMSDPRYDTDEAYRQDVFDKLSRSSI